MTEIRYNYYDPKTGGFTKPMTAREEREAEERAMWEPIREIFQAREERRARMLRAAQEDCRRAYGASLRGTEETGGIVGTLAYIGCLALVALAAVMALL